MDFQTCGKAELPITLAVSILKLAKSFIDAASMLDQLRGGISMPRYFLCGHGIELALKAMLVAWGTSDQELRAIGHDLKAAVAAVKKRGVLDEIRLQLRDLSIIERLNLYYKEKEFEYYEVGLMELPPPNDLLEVAQGVLNSVSPLIERRVLASIAANAKKTS